MKSHGALLHTYYVSLRRWGPVDTTFIDFCILKEFERRNNRSPVPRDEAVMTKLANDMLLENGLDKDFLPENDISALCHEVGW